MLDPRIYRASLIAVALAVFVLAFSLTDQQGAVGTNLAPQAYNAENAYATMTSLARDYPDRRPGSSDDYDIATYVARTLGRYGFSVSRRADRLNTAAGKRTIETVTASRTGLQSGTIVVVSHRDSLGSPSVADLSGTAVLLELARVLSGETQHRTIVLVSTSGSTGQAGAAQLAKTLPGPIDAVIALGDLAGRRIHEPIVVPWSNGPLVAPTMLRNTVAAALGSQAFLRPGGTSIAGQLSHLALPLTLTEQGPFGAAGQPAVLISASGEKGPAADEPVSEARIGQLGRTVLSTVSALDTAPAVAAPSAYLLYDGKVIPPWAIRLMVLALILPVLLATVDGAARARRRGQSILRWVVWVIAGALPFLLALGVTYAAKLAGALGVTPPGPLPAGAVPIGGGGIAVLAGIVCVVTAMYFAWGRVAGALAGVRRWENSSSAGAAAGTLLVMCLTTLAIWVRNPIAAALVVPALHLWMWIVDPDLRLPGWLTAAMLVIGLLPPVAVVVYYAGTLGLGPAGVAWNGLLLVAGGHIGIQVAVEWSLLLGCLASVISIAVRAQRLDRPVQTPVTVRGPVTYAGPGSLGGTESALRARR